MLLQDHVQKPDTDFEPNLVNTVCFLVQWVVQLTTFGVNYMGHPFNQSLMENKGLALALRWGGFGFIVATLNLFPYTDWALSLVRSLPDIESMGRCYLHLCRLAGSWPQCHAEPKELGLYALCVPSWDAPSSALVVMDMISYIRESSCF